MNYKVSDNNVIRSGTAQEILSQIKEKTSDNGEIAGMSVDQHAEALIANAEYYLPRNVLDELGSVQFGTEFDKALALLSAMPASGTHIIIRQEDDSTAAV